MSDNTGRRHSPQAVGDHREQPGKIISIIIPANTRRAAPSS
jgi:hypothetical protein